MRILSVCPSVCQMRALWQNGRKIRLDFYTIRKIIYPSFLRRRTVGGGDTFYPKFWVNRPRWSEIADFEPIIARSASAVIPSEKSSINTNRKSPMHFPMGLRWLSYIDPKSPQKISLRLKKVCYKVYSCESSQQQCCRAFIGLTIHAKMFGGMSPSTWNFGSNWPRWSEIADFQSIFACSASAVTRIE